MSKYGIYFHVRRDTGNVFYVGKGSFRRAHRMTNRNLFWRRVVEKYGEPSVVWIPCTSESEAFALEVAFISAYRRAGVALCNLTDGGEGASGMKMNLEARRAISERMKGNQHCKGYKRPFESIEKFRSKVVGRSKAPWSQEAREAHCARMKDRPPRSEEWCRHISESKKGRPNLALRGRRDPPELRAKKSAAMREWWAAKKMQKLLDTPAT